MQTPLSPTTSPTTPKRRQHPASPNPFNSPPTKSTNSKQLYTSPPPKSTHSNITTYTPQPQRAEALQNFTKNKLNPYFISLLAAMTKDQREEKKVISGSTAIFLLCNHFNFFYDLDNLPNDIDIIEIGSETKNLTENYGQLTDTNPQDANLIQYDKFYKKSISYTSIDLSNGQEILVTAPESLLYIYISHNLGKRHKIGEKRKDSKKIYLLRRLLDTPEAQTITVEKMTHESESESHELHESDE